MTQFGPSAQSGCQHAYTYHELGGAAFRTCESCGMTHILWQAKSGRMSLIEVEVVGPERWADVEQEEADDVPDVSETLPEVPADEGEHAVSQRSGATRWTPRLVPVVRRPGDDDPDTAAAGAPQIRAGRGGRAGTGGQR